MKEIIESIGKHGVNVYAVTEIIDGREETVRFHDHELGEEVASLRNIYSAAKAFTMAAIGFAYDDGLLKPEDSIGKIFGKLPEGSDPTWETVTVDNLLRHETGNRHGVDLDCTNMWTMTDGDWLAVFFSFKIEDKPGTPEGRHYSDINFYILSCIVTKLTGVPMQEYLRDKFFNPAKFREWSWSADPKGRAIGGTALYLSTLDLAKLGQLWLQRGIWNGQRLLSEEWVQMALDREYAFSCRSKARQSYYKTGMLGQIVIFSYKANRVLAIESYSRDLGKVIDDVCPME